MADDQTRWKDFPEPIQDIFEGLWQEVVSLHAQWKLYLDLYGDPEKIDLLNETVPSVFQVIEESVRTNMIVSFGRLTDASSTGKKSNLSLDRLVKLLSEQAICEGGFVRSAEKQLLDIKAQCEPLTRHRNLRVAHKDLNTAINYHENPLPGIGKLQVVQALKSIGDLMNSVQMYFEKCDTKYGCGIQRGTGKDLICLIEQALEYKGKQRLGQIRE